MYLKVKKSKKLKGLIKNLHQSDGITVQVGHFSDQRHYSGYTMPELMIIHHLGLAGPIRPILSITAFKLKTTGKIFSPLRKVLSSDFNKSDVTSSMLRVGENIKTLEQSIFGSSELIPNSPQTIAIKGAGKGPMVDEGVLKESVEVRLKK